ncbi:hypothetical protein TNIN_33161 [Trichonephila inaurata madagascariensis]|uniref:Uncharacterized protein n=1 Tax=Trichonephila inaurata madagascariensis TaxID=2747483 RepID=A0A8X6KFU0_9ARAC|nr:hypothetical protein TNIN_33161 [Trichonephila inaurata madagascariensis]
MQLCSHNKFNAHSEIWEIPQIAHDIQMNERLDSQRSTFPFVKPQSLFQPPHALERSPRSYACFLQNKCLLNAGNWGSFRTIFALLVSEQARGRIECSVVLESDHVATSSDEIISLGIAMVI